MNSSPDIIITKSPENVIELNKSSNKGKNLKRKRQQVKIACLPCRRRHAGCDAGRPCKQCVKNNIQDQCVDVPKKKRSSVDFGEVQLNTNEFLTSTKSPPNRRAYSVDFSAYQESQPPLQFIHYEPPNGRRRRSVGSPDLMTIDKNKSFNNEYPSEPSPTDQLYYEHVEGSDLVTVSNKVFQEVLFKNFMMRAQIKTMAKEIDSLKTKIMNTRSTYPNLTRRKSQQFFTNEIDIPVQAPTQPIIPQNENFFKLTAPQRSQFHSSNPPSYIFNTSPQRKSLHSSHPAYFNTSNNTQTSHIIPLSVDENLINSQQQQMNQQMNQQQMNQQQMNQQMNQQCSAPTINTTIVPQTPPQDKLFLDINASPIFPHIHTPPVNLFGMNDDFH